MKKALSIFCILLILSLTACYGQANRLTGAGNTSNPENITMLDEGVWPANDYTQGLPVPSGTVVWAMLNNQRGNCSVNITDMSETDYNDYLDVLKQDGFSVVEEVPEEIKGQDYISVGTLLSDGERWLSISYLPDSFTIYISFEK